MGGLYTLTRDMDGRCFRAHGLDGLRRRSGSRASGKGQECYIREAARS